VLKLDAVRYVAGLQPAAYDIALADPPYDTTDAVRIAEAYARVPFALVLCLEHRARTALPAAPAARTRRYGDTALTFITAPS
jgi:16S rRNA G966 N2-methylase RsmD